jgi:hypothetical protein
VSFGGKCFAVECPNWTPYRFPVFSLTRMTTARHSCSSRAAPVLLIAAGSLCVILPFLRLGIPSGHDFEFHLNSWIEVLDEWRAGVLYPHWAAMAHYGCGEARFIFYPPFSWTLGAALGAVLPWKLVPAAYVCIVLTLAGWSMFLLARQWLPQADATFAALLYAANPYHIVIVYWRSAWAELMVSIYLPLLLLLVLRLEQERLRVVTPLALLLGAGWLTNVPGAVMMNYSLALLLVWLAVEQRSPASIMYGAVGACAGAAIAAVYLVPVVHERWWVHIGQVLSPGVSPLENFLFAKTPHADHDRFNLLVSIVAMWEIAILAAALFLSRRMASRRVWRLLLTWFILSSMLMMKYTFPLWTYLPELRYVQLPWRWLLCLNVPFALAVVLALRRWWMRAAVWAVVLTVVLAGWYRVQAPWWDNTADIKEMVDNEHDGIGNEGTDEYVPLTADPDEVDQKAPMVHFEGTGNARVEVKDWRAESRLIAVKSASPGKIVLRLFNYPSWRVIVNGRPSRSETVLPSGLMAVPISAGENRIRVVFVQNRDRTIGALISLSAVVALLVFSAFGRNRFQFSAR